MTTCTVASDCDQPARYAIFAAYDAGKDPIHPMLHRYPASMAGACAEHLPTFIEDDLQHPGSTQGWFIRVVME